ncbi:MAG: TlpA family protein disulfide reductase [Acidimicrobiales bacterium]
MTDAGTSQNGVETDDGVEELEIGSGPSRLAFWIAVPTALILGLLIAVLATSDTESGFGRSPLIERAAPAIVGETIAGDNFDLDDHRGRWVVVNFFASTCIPCIEEHPELVAFEGAHSPVGDAAVVSLAFSDTEANVLEFFERNGGDWDVLAADTGRYAISYGVAAVPETYLVAPNGIVTSKFIGGVTRADLENEMARLSGATS